MSNKARIALVVLAVLLLVLFLSARGIAGFYTDYLWFDSLGKRSVFTRVLRAKLGLGLAFTLGFALLSTLNLTLADRVNPPPMPEGADEAIVERYREIVGRRVWLVRIGISLLLGFIAGAPASSQWKEWLLFNNAVRFGVTDPQFGQDVSLYVFRLPFLTFVVDWLFAAFVIILIITVVAYYLNGGIRLQVQHRRVSSQVKLHISMLLAVLALLKAVGYWLARYELTASTRGAVKGATYTDVNAQLPALELLAIISLLAAALLIINVWQRGWRLPVIAVGLWVLVAIVAGTAYPAFVQRFQVQPAESRREQPYIERNIEFTRKAFNLADVDTQSYPRGPAQRRRRHRRPGRRRRLPPGRPQHRHVDLPASAGAGRLLRVPGPRRRPLHDRRPQAAGGARCPRAQPGRRPGHDVGGQAPRLHARLRRRPGAGQRGAGQRQPQLPVHE